MENVGRFVVGEYEHPGYGTLTVACNGDALEPALGTMELTLTRRYYETFDLEWHDEIPEQPVVFPVTFLANSDGEVCALTPPGAAPFDLEPIGGLRFGVKDLLAVTVEFELDDNGAVTRLIAQPLGIFLPKDAS